MSGDYLSFCSANSSDTIRVSREDEDLKSMGVKVSYVGKAFVGVHENRKAVATMVANRKLGRDLRDDEKIGFLDRNSLNLTRDNVVIANVSDRTRYSRPCAGCTSKYKGVSWSSSRGKWCAQASIGGRSTNLGRYDREEDAARAYDAAVGALGIPIAFRNFPDHDH